MWVTTDEEYLTVPKDGHWWQILPLQGSKYPMWGELCVDKAMSYNTGTGKLVYDGDSVSPAKTYETVKDLIDGNPRIEEDYESRQDIAAPSMKVVRVIYNDKGSEVQDSFYYSFEDCEVEAGRNREEEKIRNDAEAKKLEKYQ